MLGMLIAIMLNVVPLCSTITMVCMISLHPMYVYTEPQAEVLEQLQKHRDIESTRVCGILVVEQHHGSDVHLVTLLTS